MGATCCNSEYTPKVADTDSFSERKKRSRSNKASVAQSYSDSDTDISESDSDMNTTKKVIGIKGRNKRRKRVVPIERDESFIPSSPEHTPPAATIDDQQHDGFDVDPLEALGLPNHEQPAAHSELNEVNEPLSESEELLILAYRLYTNLEIKDRKYHRHVYKDCFLGTHLVDYLVNNHICLTRNCATKKGVLLMKYYHIHHVTDDHGFEDAEFFYAFIDPSKQFKDISKYLDIIKSREDMEKDTCMKCLAEEFEVICRKGFDVKDRKYHLKTYKQCFVGEEAVSWMCRNKIAAARNGAVEIAQLLMDHGIIEHVTKQHTFKDDEKFYRFIDH